MIIPVNDDSGMGFGQDLMLIRKNTDSDIVETRLQACLFGPLVKATTGTEGRVEND